MVRRNDERRSRTRWRFEVDETEPREQTATLAPAPAPTHPELSQATAEGGLFGVLAGWLVALAGIVIGAALGLDPLLGAFLAGALFTGLVVWGAVTAGDGGDNDE